MPVPPRMGRSLGTRRSRKHETRERSITSKQVTASLLLSCLRPAISLTRKETSPKVFSEGTWKDSTPSHLWMRQNPLWPTCGKTTRKQSCRNCPVSSPANPPTRRRCSGVTRRAPLKSFGAWLHPSSLNFSFPPEQRSSVQLSRTQPCKNELSVQWGGNQKGARALTWQGCTR